MNGHPRPRPRAGLSRPYPRIVTGPPKISIPHPGTSVKPGRITPPRCHPVAARGSGHIAKQESHSPLTRPEVTYFSVLYTKRSKKKRKSWLDGYVIVKNDRYVELLNESGKKVASERYKSLGGLKDGNTLEVATYELEVQTSVTEDDYTSGRLFVKPLVQTSKLITPKTTTKRIPFKPLHPKNRNAQSKDAGSSIGPMHDPNALDALVLLPAQDGILPGNKRSVPVVLDPFLGKQMRPHQRAGVKFLYNSVEGTRFCLGEGGQGAILADEMGLGKSLQAIALIWTMLKQSPTGSPLVAKAVIVCPASLVQNWITEVKKWLGFDRLKPVEVTSGSSTFEAKEALAAFLNGTVRRLLVISYEMFRSYADQLHKSQIGLMVCDEGHRLKSSQGNKTIEALKRLPCRRRVILTGTPVQNDLEEFFAVCDFVNPGCFNSLASFRSVFANPIIASRDSNAPPDIVNLGHARGKELGRITSCFVLRRTSNILAKYLPSKREVAVFCRLQPRQEAEYMQEARSSYANISSSGRFSAALSAITFLRKICCHPVLVRRGTLNDSDGEFSEPTRSVSELQDGNGRIPPAIDVSESSKMQVALSICQASLANHDRVVLVSNYTSALDLLQAALIENGIQFCRLDGGTAVKKRGDIVRRFNQGSMGDVFLLSAKAGGVGLNLIGANRLILFDPDWNPATDLQAMARVWRDGQKKAVFVYRLLCTGTIEEKIFQRQLFKGELQSAVDAENGSPPSDSFHSINTKPGGIIDFKEGNFSTDELRDLFRYSSKHKFCDTLEVLQRSQDEASRVRCGDVKRKSSLLNRFREYENVFEAQSGCTGDVFCDDDEVLGNAMHNDIATYGIVSYLFAQNTGNDLHDRGAPRTLNASGVVNSHRPEINAEGAAKQQSGSIKPNARRRTKRLGPNFESDSEHSSDEDPEFLVLSAMLKRGKNVATCTQENCPDRKRTLKGCEEPARATKQARVATRGARVEKHKQEPAALAMTWDEAIDELGDDSLGELQAK